MPGEEQALDLMVELEDESGQVPLAVKIDELKRNTSPFGLKVAAMLLLSDLAKAAEAAPNPVNGASVIDALATFAKQHYMKGR